MADGFSFRERGGITWLEPDIFGGGVRAAFMTRLGGVSRGIFESLNLGLRLGDERGRVLENYRRAGNALDLDIERLVAFKQVHSDTVVRADGRLAGCAFLTDIMEADGVMTCEPGLPLAVYSADCAPILLFDPDTRCAAAVHAGWRGTAAGIAAKAVDSMMDAFGAVPGRILAAIGPRICGCCFETGPEVAAEMASALGDEAERHIRSAGGKLFIDLGALNALWLARSGVKESNIAVSELCTAERVDLFWSHRGTRGERGVQAAVICLCPAEER